MIDMYAGFLAGEEPIGVLFHVLLRRKLMRRLKLLSLVLLLCAASQMLYASPLLLPSPETYTKDYVVKFQKTADDILAPLYSPLAEQIATDFNLVGKKGIGIDLGSGPGNLIIELCKRTKDMYWVNADINPYFFPVFFKAADEAGFGHRVGAIFADAQALPFRDDYADIIVSRGSFHFWGDRQRAFSEIYRVLKPGGVAFIGRGFSANLPVAVARNIRAKQQKGKQKPKYDKKKTAEELRSIMKSLGITNFRIMMPKPKGSEGINYGIWLEFHKK